MRFGQAKGTELVATSERHEPVPLLRLVAESHEDGANRAVVHRDDGRGAAVPGGDFFEDDRERHIVESSAAPGVRDRNTEAAEFGETRERLARKGVLAIPTRGVRRDPLAHEGPHAVADQALFFAKPHRSFPSIAAHAHQGIAAPVLS